MRGFALCIIDSDGTGSSYDHGIEIAKGQSFLDTNIDHYGIYLVAKPCGTARLSGQGLVKKSSGTNVNERLRKSRR
jgi:hypothetical protein